VQHFIANKYLACPDEQKASKNTTKTNANHQQQVWIEVDLKDFLSIKKTVKNSKNLSKIFILKDWLLGKYKN